MKRAILLLSAICVWGFAGWKIVRPHADASLFALVGDNAIEIPQSLQQLSAKRIQVVLTAATTNAAHDAATQFRANLAPDDFATSRDGSMLSGLLSFFMEYSAGLMTADDAAKLERGEYKSFTKRTLNRLYSSPIPQLTPFELDPFGITERFILSLPQNFGAWQQSDNGLLTAAEPDGRISTLITLTLADSATDTRNLPDVLSRLRATAATLPADVSVEFSGVSVHTAVAAERCRRSLTWLTSFSIVFILALAFFAFRSLKPLPLFLYSLVVSGGGGFAALVTICGDFHPLSCVFGTTVLGIVIDYSFHRLLSGNDRASVNSMLISFITTEASLIPLAFSGLTVLTEAAVFIGFGLLTQLLTVLWIYPNSNWESEFPTRVISNRNRAFVVRGTYLLLPLAIFGFAFAHFSTPIASLYTPTPELLAAETHLHQLNGETPNAMLERIFPPLEQRLHNAELIKKLYHAEAAALAETLETKPFALPPEPKNLTLNPERIFADFLSKTTRLTVKLLGGAALVIIAILFAFFRLRAFRVALPSIVAVGSIFAALTLTGSTVTLFHLLAAFMLIGISLDYAVFMANDYQHAKKPVVCSFLTSIAGFGALVFVPFPIAQAMGLTLAIGLSAAIITTFALFRPAPPPQTEQGASTLGMTILWWFYRLLGANAYRLLTACVAAFVWIFNAKVRRNCGTFRRLHCFTQGMADKLLAMSDGNRAVRVELDDSAEAKAFVAAMDAPDGLFIISSHLGTIEVLPAAAECGKTLHAFMRVAETAVFNKFYARRRSRQHVIVEDLTSFSIGDFFKIGSYLDSGDAVLMAGDRAYGKTRTGRLGDRTMNFPAGVFRLAELTEKPVFFIACVRIRRGVYRAIITRALPSQPLFDQYLNFLSPLVATYPDQWYQWDMV